MKKILENKKLITILIIVFFIVIIILFSIMIAKRSNKAYGNYITIDINQDSIKVNYDSKDNITKVSGSNEDVKESTLVDGLDKILANYQDGTIILFGLSKDNETKKIEEYLINDYKGIDRHIIKVIYFDEDYLSSYKNELSLGKYMLLKKSNLLDKGYNDKSINEVIEYINSNSIDTSNYLYSLDMLDGYHTRD